jgi:DNA-binding NarL/FixJ family response regulator
LNRRSSAAPGDGPPAKPQTGAKARDEVAAVGDAPRAPELRVLLADGQVPVRAGIKRLIEPHGLRVVAEAANADEAVHLSRLHRPNVCVVAVELPGSGIEAARMIKQALPAAKIVMMTSAQRDEDLFEALRAGADGYLLMSTSADRLPHAILGVACGEAALPRPLTARLISEFRQRGTKRRVLVSPAQGEVELTAREFEVLGRLRKREATADIATHLGISQVTVRRHVASVLRKLGVSNRRQAMELLEDPGRAEEPGSANGG